MSQTTDNLKTAFAGESQANRKYLAFAKAAEKDGLKGVARLFKAAAEAETVHAHAHLRALGGIGSTADNLKAALAGETYEYESMYPPMIETAKAEGDKKAERTFTYANEVEKVHAELFRKALAAMDQYPEMDFYICPLCGYTVEKEPPDQCPVCKAKKDSFYRVD